jgi:hypothetical protein
VNIRHLQDGNTVIRIGLVLLIVSSICRYFLHPSAAVSESLVDWTTGLLYGVTIGCLLLGIAKNTRSRTTSRFD